MPVSPKLPMNRDCQVILRIYKFKTFFVVLAQTARDLISKMLVVDPNYRISVEEALQHPYVNLWYDTSEVDAPPSGRYDSAVESGEHTVEDWKGNLYSIKQISFQNILVLIYDEIKRYETQHDIFGAAGPNCDLSLVQPPPPVQNIDGA